MLPPVRSKSLVIERWMMLILMMTLMMILMMMILMMILMMIMMTEPYDYDVDTDDNGHKNDSYTAAGAVPVASVPCSLFIYRFR